MEPTKVIIENWPKSSYWLIYIPITIAVISLLVSLYSTSLTRRSFIASNRPFVWASNYGVIDTVKKTIIPIPHRVAYRVINSPALISLSEVKIFYKQKQIYNFKDESFVRFPDNSSEWNFGFDEKTFKGFIDRGELDQLVRHVSINYSALGGGRTYTFVLEQVFNALDNQWKTTRESAT